jgi:hypothetical protein
MEEHTLRLRTQRGWTVGQKVAGWQDHEYLMFFPCDKAAERRGWSRPDIQFDIKIYGYVETYVHSPIRQHDMVLRHRDNFTFVL